MGALTAIVICLVVHGLKKNKKEDANLEELRLFVRKVGKRGSFLVALVLTEKKSRIKENSNEKSGGIKDVRTQQMEQHSRA